jgi:hypothetical protein
MELRRGLAQQIGHPNLTGLVIPASRCHASSVAFCAECRLAQAHERDPLDKRESNLSRPTQSLPNRLIDHPAGCNQIIHAVERRFGHGLLIHDD